MNKNTTSSVLLTLLLAMAFLFSNSRVAFSRPGTLVRTIGPYNYNADNLFSVQLGTEIHSLGRILSYSTGATFIKVSPNGNIFGFSYGIRPYTGQEEAEMSADIGTELGFHYQKDFYNSANSTLTFGIHDLIVSDNVVQIDDVSFFVKYSSIRPVSDYTLYTMFGLGVGKLAYDPHAPNITESDATTAGVFAALQLNTPFLHKYGGMNVITEFVHSGINLGITIPLSRDYSIALGVTHIENISDFSAQSESVDIDADTLGHKAPGLAFGLTINIPSFSRSSAKYNRVAEKYPLQIINGRTDSSLFNAGEYIYYLQDSISLLQQDMHLLASKNIGLVLANDQQQDSLNSLILQREEGNVTQNGAMRHLSNSLRLYYENDYKQALNEIDQVISLQPKLAIAYARKGSIYYKLNQLDRATLNWNIALKLDPHYSEVREMLNILNQNRFRPPSNDE